MKMEYFEYLLEIARYKNMRVSSEYLHMTPQALSICVKNMEEEVGFMILDRKPKGVEFTEQGEKRRMPQNRGRISHAGIVRSQKRAQFLL